MRRRHAHLPVVPALAANVTIDFQTPVVTVTNPVPLTDQYQSRGIVLDKRLRQRGWGR